MMRIRKVWLRLKGKALGLAGVFILTACQSSKGQAPVAATSINPTPESIAELNTIVRKALKINQVILSDAALTQSDTLVVEPPQKRNLEHGVINGRILEKPEIFKLIKENDQCLLEHPKSQQRWLLTQTKCQPMRQ